MEKGEFQGPWWDDSWCGTRAMSTCCRSSSISSSRWPLFLPQPPPFPPSSIRRYKKRAMGALLRVVEIMYMKCFNTKEKYKSRLLSWAISQWCFLRNIQIKAYAFIVIIISPSSLLLDSELMIQNKHGAKYKSCHSYNIRPFKKKKKSWIYRHCAFEPKIV